MDIKNPLGAILIQEKLQAGLRPQDLYYIGMADTAGWWWCGRKSILKNTKMELNFFIAHLKDRLEYSIKLGYVDEKIRMKPINEAIRELPKLSKFDIENMMKMTSVRQDLSKEEIELIALMASKMCGDTMAAEEGIKDELLKAEKYPTIRWAFRWRDFMVCGVPDGITDNFVYEFKRTVSKFLLRYVKPVAFAQADLYGYFFGRPKKKVQILIKETNEIKTWIEQIDEEMAELTLEKFREVVRQNRAPEPPASWKCKRCEYREHCAMKFKF